MKKITVTVKKAFTDRWSGKKHNPGEKLTVTDDRLREIKRSGDYVEVAKADPAKPAADNKK